MLNPFIKNFYLLFVLTISPLFSQGGLLYYGNSRPVADAGPDIDAVSYDMVKLDGSKSYIADGSELKYEWTFAPGLVRYDPDEFDLELSSKPYGRDQQFLKSVKTYKPVLEITLANNPPGTKLEVILKVEDRIGFDAQDTLYIEYIGQVVDQPNLIPLDTSYNANENVFEVSEKPEEGISFLLGSLIKDELDPINVQIVNTIIIDQMNYLGYQFPVSINDNLKNNSTNKNFNNQCFTDSCIAMNAQYNGNSHVLSWSIDSDGKLLLRVFASQSFSEWIDQTTIKSPFAKIENSGIYGLDPSVRSAVNRVFTNKTFFRELSLFNRLKRRGNEASGFLSRHPFVFGLMVAATTYFVIPEEESQKTTPPPPSFPH